MLPARPLTVPISTTSKMKIEKAFIDTLRAYFKNKPSYLDLLLYVKDNLLKDNLPTLTPDKSSFVFSETMQEAILILAMKSYNITDLNSLTSFHVNEVMCDLLLKATDDDQEDKRKNSRTIYEFYMEATKDNLIRSNLIDQFADGKIRLNRHPLRS